MDGNKQNAELTFKYNKALGRHGWLRLTPAYSVKMVEDILSGLRYSPLCVLEPFSGTGTTELVCANKEISVVAYDVNPFLVWLANVKCSVYQEESIRLFNEKAKEIAGNIDKYAPYKYPPIYNIQRWWNSGQLEYLARVKSAIWQEKDEQVSNLLKIVFCRLVIELSNAVFNHVSTSFQDGEEKEKFSYKDGNNLLLSLCKMITDTVTNQPKGKVDVLAHNSMLIPKEMEGNYDTLITSPPYPNRISYIRELRPYMYWMDYLNTAEDASNLDWDTIGGTWGSATSRLSTWKRQTELLPDYLYEITDKIASADNKSAGLMSNYVLKYFDDIAVHMQSVFETIKEGGTVHYIVGNSNFYDNVVPSDELYKSILAKVGFKDEKSIVVRKRNCNKALYEYWITARK